MSNERYKPVPYDGGLSNSRNSYAIRAYGVDGTIEHATVDCVRGLLKETAEALCNRLNAADTLATRLAAVERERDALREAVRRLQPIAGVAADEGTELHWNCGDHFINLCIKRDHSISLYTNEGGVLTTPGQGDPVSLAGKVHGLLADPV